MWAWNKCFWCEEQYTPNHFYSNALLQVLIATRNDEIELMAVEEGGIETTLVACIPWSYAQGLFQGEFIYFSLGDNVFAEGVKLFGPK